MNVNRQGTAVVVMGPSGCGKSSLGQGLAAASGRRFVEGDDLHAAASIARMAAGSPLDDIDRWPWLARIADQLGRPEGTGGVVASCSALKRSYRDFLRDGAASRILFVFPRTPAELLRRRLRARPEHFMPATLLDSQLETLELPAADEEALVLDGTAPMGTLVARALAALSVPAPGGLREENC